MSIEKEILHKINRNDVIEKVATLGEALKKKFIF